MKTRITILLLLLGFASCKHRIDPASKESIWADKSSLTGYNFTNKIYYPDSSWVTRTDKVLLDSNFTKRNLRIIDKEFAELLDQYRQLFKYRFYILDTIQYKHSLYHLLILEQYWNIVSIDKSTSLRIIVSSGDSVISSYKLAEKYEANCYSSTTSSIMLPENKIITRSVSTTVSDAEDPDHPALPNSSQVTQFFRFDQQLRQFVSWKKSITTVRYWKE